MSVSGLLYDRSEGPNVLLDGIFIARNDEGYLDSKHVSHIA
jgi:hypothetical protein